jgi:hypothetical protein
MDANLSLKLRAEIRPTADQSGVLPLPEAQRCLSRGFQGVNYKCGPVLFRSIEPGALNHFTPIWGFENPGYGHRSAARF